MRASKKLRSEEHLVLSLSPVRLKMSLDNVPLWRGDHVPVKQLVEDFAKYLYLPRVSRPDVVIASVKAGAEMMTWKSDSFAVAEVHDEADNRYRGIRGGQNVSVSADSGMLVVKGEVAARQLDEELKPVAPEPGPSVGLPQGGGSPPPAPPGPPPTPAPRKLTRFHGTVQLDASRAGRDAGRIADEIISHLAGLVGADVTVTLEIEASIPGGASEGVVRTVTENSRTLKFSSHGFEVE